MQNRSRILRGKTRNRRRSPRRARLPDRGRISHEQARGAYTKRDDIIRCVLEECDTFIKFGKPSCALISLAGFYGSYLNRPQYSSSTKGRAISLLSRLRHRQRRIIQVVPIE
jgi:hypothetical protein